MKISNVFKGDKVIWMVFFFLCLISIVEVFSASSGLTYKSNNFIMPIMKHSGLILGGVVVTIFTSHIPCRYFKLMTPFLIILSLLLLIVVLFIGEDINGAQRQFSIAGVSVQPSEIAKGTTVLAVAQILAVMQEEGGAHRDAFKYIMWVTVPIAFLIMLENLSTAALLCVVVVLMMFVGRVPWSQLGKLVGVVLTAIVVLFAAVMLLGESKSDRVADASDGAAVEATAHTVQTFSVAAGSDADAAATMDDGEEGIMSKVFHRFGTWKGRINKFMDTTTVAPQDWDLDKDAQVAHANIAIASSEIIGVGPGNSVERDFLSQAFSDFIYAIIIEEMGIIGATFVVLLYLILLFRTLHIAGRCANNFPAFFAMGLALLLVLQATFNMLVAVGLVPVTGQPLPLISKGGSATVINCAYIGAILSISRTAKKATGNNEQETVENKDEEV